MLKRIIISLLLITPQLTIGDSKILATSGGTMIEGAAGGGLVPWAIIGGYGDAGEWGGGAAITRVQVDDFELNLAALHIGISNRIELSVSQQALEVQPLNLTLRQDILGAKLRLFGDLIYGDLPQVTLGIQHKHNRDSAVPYLLGAEDNSGTDYYLAASKLWLNTFMGRNLLINYTLRHTEANQLGLLGFGSSDGSSATWVSEASVGLFLNRYWAIGAEYREKPDLLNSVDENDWRDLFIAWFPNKRIATVLAYSQLGDIAGLTDQNGWYLSVQLNY